MTPEQIELVQRTWRAVLLMGDTAAELFYGKLFSLDPGIRALFRNDMLEQGRSLGEAFTPEANVGLRRLTTRRGSAATA